MDRTAKHQAGRDRLLRQSSDVAEVSALVAEDVSYEDLQCIEVGQLPGNLDGEPFTPDHVEFRVKRGKKSGDWQTEKV